MNDRTSPPHAPDLPWYYRPLGVLILLFFVLGPLALPYLWKSPRFSQGMKIVLTVATVAYTALLLQQTLAMVHAIQDQLNGLQEGP